MKTENVICVRIDFLNDELKKILREKVKIEPGYRVRIVDDEKDNSIRAIWTEFTNIMRDVFGENVGHIVSCLLYWRGENTDNKKRFIVCAWRELFGYDENLSENETPNFSIDDDHVDMGELIDRTPLG